MAENTHVPLTLEEIERLRLFQRRVQDLRECGVVTQGKVTLEVDMPLGGTVDWDTIPFKGFERDHFRSAMQSLRQFTLNDDVVCFMRTCKLIRRRCESEELVNWTEYARSFWKQTLDSAPLSFRVGSKLFTVKVSLDLMFYGFIAHTITDFAKEWEALSPGGRATIYFIVQRSIFDLCFSLNLVDSVIRYWLDTPDLPIPKLGHVTYGDGSSKESAELEEGDS